MVSFADCCLILVCFFNQQARDRLQEQKLKYLQFLTLYSELKELLIEYDMKKQEIHPGSTMSQVRAVSQVKRRGEERGLDNAGLDLPVPI